MNTRLLLAAVLATCVWDLRGNAEEPFTYPFGKDELVFSRKPGEELSAHFKLYGTQVIEMAHLPVRKGVTFYRVPKVGLAAEMENHLERLSWENVGNYLGEIHRKEEMTSLLAVLHDTDVQKERFSFDGYSRILQYLTPAKAELPLVVSPAPIEESTIKAGYFERDGMWLAHFLLLEYATVVEYKYAFSKKNGVARIRRVVIEGPKYPIGNNSYSARSTDPEVEERLRTFERCYNYLISQTMDNDRRKNRRKKTVAENAKLDGLKSPETLDLGDGVKMELVLIPAGKFMMGSPETEAGRDNEEEQHEVTLTKAYWMGKYEVTQEEYEQVMEENPSQFVGARNPVEIVSWNDAQEFCRKLSERTGREVRLPTEAEWEYACRAGANSRFYTGDVDEDLARAGWYCEIFGNHFCKSTNQVGQKTANGFGLYDMHGNVWEWCADWYGEYAKGAQRAPTGVAEGEARVMRGGSWSVDPRDCRSASRDSVSPDTADSELGFRVVISARTVAAGNESWVTVPTGSAGQKHSDAETRKSTTDTGGTTPAGVVTDQPPKSAAPTSTPEDNIPWPFDGAEAKRRQRETALRLGTAVETALDLGDGVKMELVLIPAGTFMMGSPETEEDREEDEMQHQVTLTKPYWMGKYEVTQEEYERVMEEDPARFKGARNPVESVSWEDAQEFCRKLSERTGREVRLTTEAEWEYACRAGRSTPFHTGETISTVEANYDGDYTYGDGTKGEDREKTIAVGSLAPNAFGLYDMHGNVWEWCGDWYLEYGKGAQRDPTGAADGTARVLRGGSWFDAPRVCRSANRNRSTLGYRSYYVGFRVVISAQTP